MLFHDIAHYQLATPRRRRSANFGLDADDMCEEWFASILGIRWYAQYAKPQRVRDLMRTHQWYTPRGRYAGNDPGPYLRWFTRHGYLKRGKPTGKVRQVGDAVPRLGGQ
jgi:uncharacterized protein (DUF3820 family)